MRVAVVLGGRAMSPGARTELGATVGSARAARDFVRRTLDMWEVDDPDEVAILLTSEVVSNAVLHAATRLALDIDLDDETHILRIGVRDGTSRPAAVRVPDAGATGGRGLLLVDQLARRWGSEPDGAGKVVWFELAARRRGVRSDQP